MSDGRETANLDTLLTQLVSGDISQDEVRRLQNAVGRDSEHLDYCRDFMMVSCGLERLLHEQDQQASVWLKETLKGELEKPVTLRSRVPWKQVVTALAAMVLIGLSVGYVVANRGGRAKSHLGEVINGLNVKWADLLDKQARLDEGRPTENVKLVVEFDTPLDEAPIATRLIGCVS